MISPSLLGMPNLLPIPRTYIKVAVDFKNDDVFQEILLENEMIIEIRRGCKHLPGQLSASTCGKADSYIFSLCRPLSSCHRLSSGCPIFLVIVALLVNGPGSVSLPASVCT